jgi:aerobic C4-dicarboxylate transport protein
MGGKIPVEGLALLVGIDRFMAEARSITNLIGNSVATLVVAKWEGALDMELATRVLNGDIDADEGNAVELPAVVVPISTIGWQHAEG